MTDKQFWKWASSWLDAGDICNQAEGWDEEEKIATLKEFKKLK